MGQPLPTKTTTWKAPAPASTKPTPAKSTASAKPTTEASPVRQAPAQQRDANCLPPPGKVVRYRDHCNNGDCVRIFKNGCKKRFQVPYCYDALSGEWTWKPDGC